MVFTFYMRRFLRMKRSFNLKIMEQGKSLPAQTLKSSYIATDRIGACYADSTYGLGFVAPPQEPVNKH